MAHRAAEAIFALTLALATVVSLGLSTLSAGGPGPTTASAATTIIATLRDSNWSTYLHDPARTGANPNETLLSPTTAPFLTLDWKFLTKGFLAAQPIVVGHTLYVGSNDGSEYALNASTGQKIWAHNLSTSLQPNCSKVPRGIISSATVANGTVYVGSGTAWWYALNATTGKTVFRVFIGNASRYYNWGSPLILDHDAFIGTSSGCDMPLVRASVLEVDLTTHRVVHQYYLVRPGQIGASVWSSPTYDATTHSIWVTTGNGNHRNETGAESIVRLNATTLQLVGEWQVPRSQTGPDSDFGTTPTLATTSAGAHIVVAGNKNGGEYALDRFAVSQGPVWSDKIAVGGQCPECGQGTVSSGAWDGTNYYLAGGHTTIGSTNYTGSVRAVNPANGSYVWQYGAPGIVLGAVSYANGLVVVGAGRTLEVLNASTGASLYHFTMGAGIDGPATIAGGCIFATSTDRDVYTFGLNGTECTVPFHGTLTLRSAAAPPGAPTEGLGTNLEVAARLTEPTWAVAAPRP